MGVSEEIAIFDNRGSGCMLGEKTRGCFVFVCVVFLFKER